MGWPRHFLAATRAALRLLPPSPPLATAAGLAAFAAFAAAVHRNSGRSLLRSVGAGGCSCEDPDLRENRARPLDADPLQVLLFALQQAKAGVESEAGAGGGVRDAVRAQLLTLLGRLQGGGEASSLDSRAMDLLMQSAGEANVVAGPAKLLEMLAELRDAGGRMQEKYGMVPLLSAHPLAVHFHMCSQMAVRTPAWKAAVHMGASDTMHRELLSDLKHDSKLFDDLLGHCDMALCAYSATAEEIRCWLDGKQEGWTLAACQTEALSAQPAHFVAVRPARNASAISATRGRVVLAVRGTQELGDLVMDTLFEDVPLEEGTSHKGFVSAAENLVERYSDVLKSFEEEGFEVVLVGHSLGAAVAALTTALLRKRCGLTTARCVAVACPPCLDMSLATETTPYTTSVVLDDDVIPRLSVWSLLKLHEQLANYDWKAEVRGNMVELLESLGFDGSSFDQAVSSLVAGLSEQLGQWNRPRGAAKAPKEVTSTQETPWTAPEPLCVPGFIVHVYRSDRSVGFSASNTSPSFFHGIAVSDTMITDHSLPSYIEALQTLATEATNNLHRRVHWMPETLPDAVHGAASGVVRMARQARSNLAAAAQRRPDTS